MSMESSRLRQLAIRLACIHADDRAWVLEQFSDEQRETLDGLLDEINELGLAKNPSVVTAILDSALHSSLAGSVSILPDDVSLHDLVAKAPHPFWAALLLQGRSVEQRNKVLTGLPEIERIHQWDQRLADIEVPPAMMMAVTENILRVHEVNHG
ncbi:MAG: hypothetical protein U0998_00515 [Moraxellaceae bacterium]|nr:hypothetical protein [Moraxellaceae bacterium]MDZ4385683.1 hypothetical protein [Moraxellaceae bacterium]